MTSTVTLYRGACLALDIDPATCVLHELAELSTSTRDAADAIAAMRKAEPYDRVRSALTLLRDRANARKVPT